MRDKDRNLLLVMLGLWFIQGVLVVGPLRTELEKTLILSLVPGVDAIIGILNMVSAYGNQPFLFAFVYTITIVKDAILAVLIKRLFSRR